MCTWCNHLEVVATELELIEVPLRVWRELHLLEGRVPWRYILLIRIWLPNLVVRAACICILGRVAGWQTQGLALISCETHHDPLHVLIAYCQQL